VTSTQLIRVILWMTGTLLSFSVLAVSVRGLAGAFSVSEILAIRCGIGLIMTIMVGLARPMLWQGFVPRRLGTHFLRNSTHLAAQYLWALSVTLLPLATVFALEFTMPVWTALLAVLFLGEGMTRGRLGAIACGFAGILIILRPGLEAFRPAAMLVLAAAFGYAMSNIATKKLTSTETTFAIVLWMNVMQLPLAYAASDLLFFQKIGLSDLLPVLGVGIAGVTAHYCLTNALAAGDAGVVVPLDFMRLPLIAFVGWTFYGEALDAMVFVGAGVIVTGVLWNLGAERRRSALQSRPARGPAVRHSASGANDGSG
jgi:drug/metabolite transporter (DMT)-like permease